tara:strand:+ start:452 stop:661 length:210 start_codon:yes stop_codon:yes gene_type:complete
MKKKTGEKKEPKLRQLSVGVYLDATTNQRLNLAINKEQEKQIKSGKKPTFSKSGLCTELLEKWLDKNGY